MKCRFDIGVLKGRSLKSGNAGHGSYFVLGYFEDFCIEFDKLCENKSSFIKLPMVLKENILMYKNLPFMNCPQINADIKSSSPIDVSIKGRISPGGTFV